MSNAPATGQPDLIYGLEDTPPFWDAVFAALQHLLAMFVALISFSFYPGFRDCVAAPWAMIMPP